MKTMAQAPRALGVGLAALLATGCVRGEADPASSGAEPAAASPLSATAAEHLLLVLELSPEGLRLVTAQRVPHALPSRRRPAANEPWRLALEGAGGEPLFEASLPAATPLRSESPGDAGVLEGSVIVRDRAAFSVRVPRLGVASTLRLRGPASTLAPGDVRARGRAPDAIIELGQLALPAVLP